jgi:hypothetical protein
VYGFSSPLSRALLCAGGCRRDHVDSIESMVRNNIQKAKMDMAEEVIDAGRFDQQTTQVRCLPLRRVCGAARPRHGMPNLEDLLLRLK